MREGERLTVGQVIRVIDGPFVDFGGFVDEIDSDKGKVKVLLEFFGRQTVVELDPQQIEGLPCYVLLDA